MNEDNKVVIRFSIYNQIIKISELIDSFRLFQVKTIKMKTQTLGKFIKYDESNFLKLLELELHEEDFDILCESESESISCFKNFQAENVVCFNVTFLKDTFDTHKDKIINIVSDMMKTVGIVARISLLEDKFWQNNMQLSLYKHYGKDISEVPIKESVRFVGRNEVDVEKLPGYEKQIGNVWFGSAWQMWFNTPYYEYVSKGTIEKFDECFLNEKLSEDCTHIQLYENIEDYEEPENREKQWAFKKAIDFGTVIKIAQEMVNNKKENPMIEIEVGQFEHGGVREISTYLDENNKSIQKNKANRIELIEYDKAGNIVHKEIIENK